MRGNEQGAVSQVSGNGPEQAHGAVFEERACIARELHDVVAFHISLIAVQAETACYRAPDLPASVVAELRSVSGQAREALAEMRRLVGALRARAQLAAVAVYDDWSGKSAPPD